jgi:uncharacterized protein Yka (UPF0111/DUF47 family)
MIKTNDVNFARDPETSALINTNNTAYSLYKQQREVANQNANLNKRVEKIESQIDDIKNLLTRLVDRVDTSR